MDRVVHCFRRLHEWLHVEKLDRQTQQDPQEVLHYIFDQLCSICPRAEGMIAGQIREVTERREPGFVAEMDLPFTMLHLIVPSGEETDLESLIQLSEMPRDFHDDHEDGCITATAVRLPPILIFALDRLRWVCGVQQKVQTCVGLPTGLSSNVFTRIGEGHTFQLSGIIAHQGPGHGGHFIYLHRAEPGGRWTVFSDDVICTADESTEVIMSIQGPGAKRRRWTASIAVYQDNSLEERRQKQESSRDEPSPPEGPLIACAIGGGQGH
jgi:hypothetical protein